MKNKIEAIFIFLDGKHKFLAVISLILSIISGIMYYFFHTFSFGYSSSSEENILYAFAPVIMLVIGLPIIINSGINKRLITSILIIVLSVGVCEIPAGLYCRFIGELPPESVFIFIGYYTAVIVFSLYGLKTEIKSIIPVLKNIFRLK